MTLSSIFYRFRVTLVKFKYWSKFHVNIITGSRVMTTFIYKGSTRNPEIGNTLVWVFPNIWRLGQVGDTKFSTKVSNKKLLNASNAKVTAFTIPELLRENHQGGGGGVRWKYSPTLIRVKKWLQRRRFPVKFVKFLRKPFFKERLWWLLLELW